MIQLPPLADLHRHLDGSLRLSTLLELARGLGVTVPADLAFSPGMGLQAALSRFRVTLAVLQAPEAVRRVAREMCEDARAEGVTTLEIRFAPQLHRGASIEAIVEAATEGIEGRAGLILCGLYGEDPAVLGALVEAARRRRAVVGIDLAGGPSGAHAVRPGDYRKPLARALELGLGVTVHAGEGRPPEEIRTAIEVLGAKRIGHGTSLLEDPAVVDLVRARGVTIEACPTSNWHTGAVADRADHPLGRWLALGVRATVCCDNTLFSQIDAPAEHRNALSLAGMSESALRQSIAFGHQAAFRRG
jgi:adenosine deaminase